MVLPAIKTPEVKSTTNPRDSKTRLIIPIVIAVKKKKKISLRLLPQRQWHFLCGFFCFFSQNSSKCKNLMCFHNADGICKENSPSSQKLTMWQDFKKQMVSLGGIQGEWGSSREEKGPLKSVLRLLPCGGLVPREGTVRFMQATPSHDGGARWGFVERNSWKENEDNEVWKLDGVHSNIRFEGYGCWCHHHWLQLIINLPFIRCY